MLDVKVITQRHDQNEQRIRSSFEPTELLCNPFFAKRTSKDHSFEEVIVIFSVSFGLPKNTAPSPRVNLYYSAPVSSSIVGFHVMSSRF